MCASNALYNQAFSGTVASTGIIYRKKTWELTFFHKYYKIIQTLYERHLRRVNIKLQLRFICFEHRSRVKSDFNNKVLL